MYTGEGDFKDENFTTEKFVVKFTKFTALEIATYTYTYSTSMYIHICI